MTIASRPSTTPIACMRNAPLVPSSTVPIATSRVRFVTARSKVSRTSWTSTPKALAIRRIWPCHSPAIAPGMLTHGSKSSGWPKPIPVDHDVGDAVVVVQSDFVGVDLFDRRRLRGQYERQVIGGEPRFDARGVQRHLAFLRRGGELIPPFGRF